MPRTLKRSLDRVNDLLDRLSEHGLPQFAATSLGLVMLYQAWSFLFFADRFQESRAYSSTLILASPVTWGTAFAVVGVIVIYGSTADRDFTRGALIGVMGLQTFVGLTVVWPVAFGSTVPLVVSQYMLGNLAAMIAYLMWRVRVAKR